MLTLNCARCGHPLPPLSEAEAKLFTAGGGAVAQHPTGQCPDQLAAATAQAAVAPRVRHFEARTQIVEIIDGRDEVLVGFVSAATAPSAVAAMEAGGTLANGLGEAWQTAAQHISLADVPVAAGLANPTPPALTVERRQ